MATPPAPPGKPIQKVVSVYILCESVFALTRHMQNLRLFIMCPPLATPLLPYDITPPFGLQPVAKMCSQTFCEISYT